MNSVRHHYIPIFYTKRWATQSDGRLCQFSRPYGATVKPMRVSPAGTGYVDRLYELKGFEPTLAQQVEERFFKPVDDGAAQALELLERDGDNAQWTSRLRSAWTRFILSLLLRCPEDLEVFRAAYFRELQSSTPDWASRYDSIRSPDDPTTIEEYMAGQSEAWKSMAWFDAFRPLIDHEGIGRHINNMHWRVFEIPGNSRELMTSDRPVVRTNSLDHRDAHIALAIGPRRLFMAAKETELVDRVNRLSPKVAIEEYNQMVVEGACKFVYATNDVSLRFVQNRMARNPQRRLMQALAERMDTHQLNISN